jgi:hypothetical protein
MILINESRSPQTQACHSVTFPTKNPIYTGLKLNLGLRGEKLATNRLNHGLAPDFAILGYATFVKATKTSLNSLRE